MDRPLINYDVALQYDPSLVPTVVAICQGRDDFIRDSQCGGHSPNPYRTAELRSHWLRGYTTEKIDLVSAAGVR